MTYNRKLIEVALPLDAINAESAREKSIRQGHPSTLHLWWARRPLAAVRAVIWASMVDDPSSHPDRFPSKADQDRERQRLFQILERLIKWDNANDTNVLAEAQRELPADLDELPPVLDPFCGGGSTALEAQRLGLTAVASDLNPIAVLVTKAMVEIPPLFDGMRPVRPASDNGSDDLRTWVRAQGLAEDVRFYGDELRSRARAQVIDLYPEVEISDAGRSARLRPLAWLWARTVRCPNPSCGVVLPLVRSLDLSRRRGSEFHLEPWVEDGRLRFTVEAGRSPIEGSVTRRGARCFSCAAVIPFDYLRAEGGAGRMHEQMIALVVQGGSRREYLEPTERQIEAAASAGTSNWLPTTDLPEKALGFRIQAYGFRRHSDMFTGRQLASMTAHASSVGAVRDLVYEEAVRRGLVDDRIPLASGGKGATAYADAISVYLALGVSRLADISNAFCTWKNTSTQVVHMYTRQSLAMVWDFAEANPFGEGSGDFGVTIRSVARVIERLPASRPAEVKQLDAMVAAETDRKAIVCTDPPYYDNIGYADLSDFFYVWLRPILSGVYPDLFSTILTPKSQELIASPFRHAKGTSEARDYFEDGLERAFQVMVGRHDSAYPLTLFYAFKQAEATHDGGRASTGWETMLNGLIDSGLSVAATWPMRSEMSTRSVARGANALASSIVLACRPRPADAPIATRSEFLSALSRELSEAIRLLQQQAIAPVDLAQSAIGPGMAVFSRFSRIIEADGSRMGVRQALGLINEALQEVLSSEETEFDGDTRWALTWYEQHGLSPAPFGDAETLSKAKDTSVSGVVAAGIAVSRDGKVRLVAREELPQGWDPLADSRATVWELTQQLIRRLDHSEVDAAELLRRVGAGYGDRARQLAYLLYRVADRKGWAGEAVAYNILVQAWPDLVKLASGSLGPVQQQLGE